MDYLLDRSVQRSDDRLRILLRVMDLTSCGEVVGPSTLITASPTSSRCRIG
jgi:hypothetical protein